MLCAAALKSPFAPFALFVVSALGIGARGLGIGYLFKFQILRQTHAFFASPEPHFLCAAALKSPFVFFALFVVPFR